MPTAIRTQHAIDRPQPAWRSDDGAVEVFQADCFEVMAGLPAGSIDCIWTDPPYLLSNDGVTCVAGRRVSVNKGGWDRSQGLELDHEFNRQWLRACARVLKSNGTLWVSGTLHIYLSVGMALLQEGYRILNDIVWEKPNPPPNLGCRCFTHATEMVLWATRARKGSNKAQDRYTFNYDLMREENGGKQMKNVWRIYAVGREEKAFGKHPTQKPLALISRCLAASTRPGDRVLDPFAGSASVGVAALQLGRQFIGCESEASYVGVAAQRLADAQSKLKNGR
ncbi:MAG: DNA-methyltransferase [Gammaproteobacteria bacterium]